MTTARTAEAFFAQLLADLEHDDGNAETSAVRVRAAGRWGHGNAMGSPDNDHKASVNGQFLTSIHEKCDVFKMKGL